MDREQFEAFLAEHADTLGDLDAVDDERLGAAHEGFASRLEELRARKDDKSLTDDELTELQEKVVPNLQAVKGQRQAREQRRNEQYQQLDAAFADLDAESADPEQGEGETEEQGEQGGEEQGETPEQVAQQPVAASGGKGGDTGGRKAPATAKPRVPAIGTTAEHADKRGARPDHRVPVSVTAAGSGETIGFEGVGKALANKLRAVRNGIVDGAHDPAVTLRASGVPDERYLRYNDPGRNTNKLDAALNPAALTAAGGLCAPLEIDYTYSSIGVTGRPVRDSLPTFQADRGGIQFRPDVSPVTNNASDGPKSATGIWTNADDEAAADPEDDTRKAVWIVDCPDTQTAQVEAITLQTEWSNVTSRFDPETVQANQTAALVWHDRFAENHLLGQLRAASKVMTSAQLLGAVCDVLTTLDKAQAYFRSVHRLGANVALRAIMPFWVRHMLRADLARRMSLDPMSVLNISDAQIDSMLQTRGLNPVWHLDGNPAVEDRGTAGADAADVPAQQYTLASANAAVPNFPGKVDMLLHSEGCFTHLDGGTLDLGIVRDSTLIDRNRYRQFSETWEGVAVRGVEALRVLAEVAPTGTTSGAVKVNANETVS